MMDFSERVRSEEHTSELQSPCNLVCRLLLEKKKVCETIHHQRERCSARFTGFVVPLQQQFRRNSAMLHDCSECQELIFFLKLAAPTESKALPLHSPLPT